MRRFLLSAAVMGLGLALTGTAAADGGRGRSSRSYQSSSNRSSSSYNYHQKYGTKCSYGYCYKGRDHCHWSSQCWNQEYGCTCYWCPSTCCNYYWCQRDDCYYPVSHRPYGCCR